ncbi:MAG: serine hydrolase domain-containing protein [Pseudomonadota bacterium]
MALVSKMKISIVGAALFGVLLFLCGRAVAADPLQGAPGVEASFEEEQDNPASLLNKKELKAFVDGVVKTAMEDHRIAGAVVAVVTPDDTLLLEGYGLANAETGETVDPSVHLFRVASITKLFTATAIMQLVEDGRVDLDADIRTYLGDLKFDDRLGAVTVSHLLTHTPGFEDRFFGYFGANPKLENEPRARQFAALAPRQVRAPGELTSYSNFGFALLGEIVARVSGKSYAQYLEDEIFTPLAMARSSTSIRSAAVGEESAKNEALRAAEAKSHAWKNGWYAPQYFPDTLDLIEPEGSLSTTAEDITRFMQVHMNAGALDGVSVLAPETVRRMHQPLFSHMPGVNGNAHGFWIEDTAGYASIAHSGSINGFISNLVLIPELGLGVFVSTNTESGSRLARLPNRVVEAFFPKPEEHTPKAAPVSKEWLSKVEGEFLGARRVQSRLGKVASLTEVISITPTPEGDLLVSDGAGADRYTPIGDGRFKALRNGEIMGFQLTQKGKAKYVFFSNAGHNGFERKTFFDEPLTFYAPLALAVLASVCVLIGYGVRVRGFAPKNASGVSDIEKIAVLASAIACLVIVIQIGLTFSNLLSDINQLYEAFPTRDFVVMKVLGYAFVAIVAATAVLSPRVMLSGDRSMVGKFRYIVYVVVMLFFVWSLFNWKLFVF